MALLREGLKMRIPNIILFGAPGVGKGTYGKLLEKDLKFKKISTGDQIRSFTKKPDLSPELEEIRRICTSGGLVSDSMVLDIITDSLSNLKDYQGVIFDGFPRNVSQLELFSQRFDLDYSYIVNCILNEDILVEKLAGRRVCNDCGSNFNICSINKDGYDMRPLLPKHGGEDCDCCGGKIVQRDDDKEHTVRHRLQVYKKETEPLLLKFRGMGLKVMDFEPKRGIDDYPTLFTELQDDYFSQSDLQELIRVQSTI